MDLKEPEARRQGRLNTLTDWMRARADVVLTPVARFLGRLGIHPNTLTITGFLLQAGVGALFAAGWIRLGGGLLLAFAPLDALDGAVARAVGKASSFGAFLDSTLDRLADALLIIGLAWDAIGQGAQTEAALLLAGMVAALIVSYTRARAESLGISCRVGVATRMERILLIGVLSILGLVPVLAWALVVLSAFTLVQRIVRVYACSSGAE